jgi:hypothetical protein
MGPWLRRVAFLCACGLAALAAGLWALEQSDSLTRLVRRQIAREFPVLSRRLGLQHVSLRWFQPGLVLEGVTLHAEGGASRELLRLERLHVALYPDLGRARSITVHGGRVLLRERLIEELEGLVGPRRRPYSGPLPVFSLRELELAFELPDGRPFELGGIDLSARPLAAGGFELSGRFRPTLAGAVSEPGAILVSGSIAGSGLELRASARELPLETERFRVPEVLGSLPVSEFSGRLTLDASFALPFGGELQPHAALRAVLVQGRLRPSPGAALWEELDLGVDADFQPRPGLALWHRDAWDARLSLAARSGTTPLVAWAEFGRGVRDGAWLRAWARAQGVSLQAEALEALGVEERFRIVREIFEPSGRVDLDCSLLARPAAERGWSRELGLHLGARGELGLTFHGWPGAAGSGLPLPAEGVRGDLLFTQSAGQARPWRLAAVDLAGDHGSGQLSGWAQVGAALQQGSVPDFDLVLHTPSAEVGDRLRQALAGNPHLSWLWPAFSPTGGRIGADWRMRSSPETGGMTAAGSFSLTDLGLRWKDLPVPLEGLDGRIELVWAALPARLLPEDPARPHKRPVGVVYELDNTGGPRAGARARIHGLAREESLPASVARSDLSGTLVQEIAVEIHELLLRGSDFEVLAARFPALRREVEALGARGRMHVSYRGARPAPGLSFASDIEGTPREVEITPRFFQRRIRDLSGRILIQTPDAAGKAADLAQFCLAGSWAGGDELAARGTVPGAGPAQVRIFGAGVDPSNTSFKGALVTSLSAASGPAAGGIDLSGWTLRGQVDFAVESLFDPAGSIPPANRYRVYLRGNDLETRNLRLESMHGAFEQSGELLESPLVFAALGRHPIVLSDVRMFPLGAAQRVPGADPWLFREGFWKDPRGRALQADLEISGLPLDAEHLTGLLSEQALADLRRNESWRGAIDVRGARILVTSEEDGSGKVAVRGPVRPHDLSMRLGVPISVASADVQLEELVLESGRFRGWARIEELSARIAERELSGARMIAGYVDGRLTVDDLSGDFEGGRLSSLGGASKALGIDLSDPHRFDVGLRLEDVGVEGLLRGVFQSSIADQGLLDASLQLSGTPDEVLGLTGRGTLSLDEGSLWSIPVMRELFRQLGFDSTGVFDRLRARWELRDGRIQVSRAELKSDLFDLVGRGWQDLDGRLAFDLEVRYGLLDRLGPLSRVLYWLNNNLWRVAVRGDFGRPRVVIRNSLLEMLRRFDEEPARQLPLPGFSRLGARF